jgi:hypothetical protein
MDWTGIPKPSRDGPASRITRDTPKGQVAGSPSVRAFPPSVARRRGKALGATIRQRRQMELTLGGGAGQRDTAAGGWLVAR